MPGGRPVDAGAAGRLQHPVCATGDLARRARRAGAQRPGSRTYSSTSRRAAQRGQHGLPRRGAAKAGQQRDRPVAGVGQHAVHPVAAGLPARTPLARLRLLAEGAVRAEHGEALAGVPEEEGVGLPAVHRIGVQGRAVGQGGEEAAVAGPLHRLAEVLGRLGHRDQDVVGLVGDPGDDADRRGGHGQRRRARGRREAARGEPHDRQGQQRHREVLEEHRQVAEARDQLALVLVGQRDRQRGEQPQHAGEEPRPAGWPAHPAGGAGEQERGCGDHEAEEHVVPADGARGSRGCAGGRCGSGRTRRRSAGSRR